MYGTVVPVYLFYVNQRQKRFDISSQQYMRTYIRMVRYGTSNILHFTIFVFSLATGITEPVKYLVPGTVPYHTQNLVITYYSIFF